MKTIVKALVVRRIGVLPMLRRRSKDPGMDMMIDNYHLDNYVLSGKDEEAMVLAEKYHNHEILGFPAYLAFTSISNNQGEKEKTSEYIKQLESMAKNDYYQKVVEAWKQKNLKENTYE